MTQSRQFLLHINPPSKDKVQKCLAGGVTKVSKLMLQDAIAVRKELFSGPYDAETSIHS
jgi:hypothetical protein